MTEKQNQCQNAIKKIKRILVYQLRVYKDWKRRQRLASDDKFHLDSSYAYDNAIGLFSELTRADYDDILETLNDIEME